MIKRNTKSGMENWFPKIEALPIRQPKTFFVPIPEPIQEAYWREEFSDVSEKILADQCRQVVKENKLKYPIFLRTNHSACKHSWKMTCYIAKPSDFEKHIAELIFGHITADFIGLPFNFLIIREFIEMNTLFYAFYGDMPVNREFRFFIKNQTVQCSHPYWSVEPIKGHECEKTHKNWKRILKHSSELTKNELALLTGYAKQVAGVMEGYWSVDFIEAKDGTWVMCDLATGGESYHLPTCYYAEKLSNEERMKRAMAEIENESPQATE